MDAPDSDGSMNARLWLTMSMSRRSRPTESRHGAPCRGFAGSESHEPGTSSSSIARHRSEAAALARSPFAHSTHRYGLERAADRQAETGAWTKCRSQRGADRGVLSRPGAIHASGRCAETDL